MSSLQCKPSVTCSISLMFKVVLSGCLHFGSQEEAISLIHIGNDADYSQEERIERWKKLWILSGKWAFKTDVFADRKNFLTLSKDFFSSQFLSFLYWLLLFCIVHPFVWITCKTVSCLHGMVAMCAPTLERCAHTLSPCPECHGNAGQKIKLLLTPPN